TTAGAELDRAQTFTKAPGGAPANTAVGLARQGVKVGFIGRVSADEFGRWLKEVLEQDNIDTSGTVSDPDGQTRMAYVVTTATGDRKLAEFTRIACADARLEPKDLRPEQFSQAVVLHFGSISQIASPSQEATLKAVELAKENGLLVSYDPNVRLGLWPTHEACKEKILETMPKTDMVKINEDELLFLTGSKELSAADQLRAKFDLPLLIITLDSRGAYIATPQGSRKVQGFQVQLVEATGAGDGFNSGVIGGLLQHLKPAKNRRQALLDLDLNRLCEIIRHGNAIGALTCTRAGAIPALPTTEEVAVFIEEMTTAQASS
ncbi:MAG TPA: carbohydrate kinase, partial [Chroococcales cyanobacterium]